MRDKVIIEIGTAFIVGDVSIAYMNGLKNWKLGIGKEGKPNNVVEYGA